MSRQSGVRVQRAERRQMEWRALSLEQMLPEEHAARLVWAYVESLDVSKLYETIQTRDGGPGRNPIDPPLLLAVWLLATIEGVGSARRLDRLCKEHMAYLWILGESR